MKRQSGSAFSAAIFFILGATLLTMAVLAMSKINTFTIRPHLELQRSFYINEGAANRVQWLLAADRLPEIWIIQNSSTIDSWQMEPFMSLIITERKLSSRSQIPAADSISAQETQTPHGTGSKMHGSLIPT